MILKIVLGLAALSVVVIIHEFGHFIAARLCGIEVEAFSLGWGKAFLKKKIGKTEYRLSILPLGGYCKMKGEHALTEALESKEKSIPLEKGTFYSATPLQRILVSVAGPAANFIFAGLVLSIISFVGYNEQTFTNRIILASEYSGTEKKWPADEAGLQSGDKITAINGNKLTNWNQITEKLIKSAEDSLLIEIERDNRFYELVLTTELDKDTGAGIAGIYPWINPEIGSIKTGSIAEKANLLKGDIITGINNIKIENSMDIASVLESKPDILEISVKRGNATFTTEIITDFADDNFRLGISYELFDYRVQESNIFKAFFNGYAGAVDAVVSTGKGLILLISGKLNLRKTVSGPMRIIEFAGENTILSFKQGIGKGILFFSQFISFISIALFFMNLLPIPALDGGQIILYLFEIAKRSPLSPQLIYRYQMIGTIFILILVFLTTTSDILHFAGK